METEGSLKRTPSDTSSSASSRRERSSTARPRIRSKHSTAIRTPTAQTEDNSLLTSFPSLSPETSQTKRRDGSFRQRLSEVDGNQGSNKLLRQKVSMVAALTAKSPSAKGRNALFDDSPTTAIQEIPGSLHYVSDAHIEGLIARNGAVNLVRQLAEDLANREAEMSTLRQRAELRERELKKMLREVEVSNMDIEARLHQLQLEDSDNSQTPANTKGTAKDVKKGKRASIGPDIGEMMEEALENDIASGDDFSTSLDRGEEDRQATIRATAAREGDTASLASQKTTASRSTARGWKDYILGSTISKKSSRPQSIISNEEESAFKRDTGPGKRRKGLDDTLFKPLSNTQSLPDAETSSNTDKRAASMSSWTMKLFAGNSGSNRDSTTTDSLRGRAATTSTVQSKDSRANSQASVQTNSSARASLAKVDTRGGRRTITPLLFGPNGTVKSSNQSVSSMSMNSPGVGNTSTSLGPVEMDAILPHGTRPPTLTPFYQSVDDTSELLTDRFGFIYDQRRRKKEAEALARVNAGKNQPVKETLAGSIDRMDSDSLTDRRSMSPDTPTSEDVENKSATWQDYLRMPARAAIQRELLSHTPSSNTILTISNPDIKKSLRRTSTFENIRENEPLSTPNPLPSTSSITASNAEFASPVISVPTTPLTPAKTEFEPVKALLAQLGELHDNIQKEKTVKWNEFLRKVRAERRREGESGSTESRNKNAAMPEASLADGEVIGIATLGLKGKVGRAKYRELKLLILSGIPVALRAKIWAEGSGALALRIPGYYSDLITQGDDDPEIISQIQMDINRTLTDNVYFRLGPGVPKLNEVLLAYSRRNPEVGYCQGMNLITASLLLTIPTAEDAFWILVSIIENILPRHYYDKSLLTSRADQQVLKQYVAELLPKLWTHFEELNIDLEAITLKWFLSLFTACLSAEALYRVWDVLLCCKDEEGNGGSTFLFQVALALLKLNEDQLLRLRAPGEVYTYLNDEITNHAISIDGLIKASEGLKAHVRRAEVEARRRRWVALEKEALEGRSKGKGKAADRASSSLEIQDPMPIEE
jgi:small G protein signaling modulator 3